MGDEIQRTRALRERRAAEESDPRSDEPERETPPHRLSRRAKLRRALVAGGAVVLAVVVLAVLLPDAGASMHAALGIPTPVPTATLPIGAGTFMIEDTVPWGTLLVDGHLPSLEVRQPNEPVGAGPPAPTFVLDHGRHTVEYRAAPFPTLRCVVSVPAARSDTCLLAQPSPNDPVHAFGAARVLDLQARPERLPSDSLASLEQTLLAALNANIPPAQVAVGEHYLGADGAVHVATQPLVASLVYAMNQDPGQALPGDTGACVALCRSYDADQPPSDLAGTNSWLIAAHLVLTWRFGLANGTVVATNVPAAPVAGDAHELVVLGVRRHGATWDASFIWPTWGIVSDVASRVLAEAIAAITHGQGLAGYNSSAYAANPASEGCLLTEARQTVETVGGDYVPVGPTAFVLYRFGVLLAANDLAHQIFPSLPLADALERALARSLAPQSAQG
ncbi:MAG TPA: hypothetical protein VF116_22225 [Ktedonobacterales bacterium]